MSLEHAIKENGGLLIRYPSQVVLNRDPAAKMKAEVDAREYNFMTRLKKPAIDYSARQILFAGNDGFDGPLLKDDSTQKLTITIEGLMNPYNNEASSSFEIVTFTKEDNVLYFIDQVISGLIIDPQCAYPCKECSSADPTYCLACFPDSPVLYL